MQFTSEMNESAKRGKLERIRSILSRPPERETAGHFDFLTDAIRSACGIIDTEAVSLHAYDPYALQIINEFPSGLILDCGAGKRSSQRDNVVCLEVVPYESTDVLSVAENLPFRDASFDGVLCLNVLEHVRDPFGAAREIARVLKPGGRLYCVVPFLQPRHGYPSHYYNMTSEGLANLFTGRLIIEQKPLLLSGLPIWSLSWFLGSYAKNLEPKVRERFLNLRVTDLMEDPMKQLDQDYVRLLPPDTCFELASTTALLARKGIE